MFTLALQAVAVIAGLVSAYFWWRSSAKPQMVQGDLPDGGEEDGAIAITIGDSHFIYDIPGQSRLSGLGAKWAAGSILAQAASVAITAIPAI